MFLAKNSCQKILSRILVTDILAILLLPSAWQASWQASCREIMHANITTTWNQEISYYELPIHDLADACGRAESGKIDFKIWFWRELYELIPARLKFWPIPALPAISTDNHACVNFDFLILFWKKWKFSKICARNLLALVRGVSHTRTERQTRTRDPKKLVFGFIKPTYYLFCNIQ